MVAIITTKYRVFAARDFRASFDASDKNYYVFVGKPTPWSDDTQPPLTVDSVSTELDAWSDIMGLKKIVSSGVSHVIPRRTWTSGTLYFPYRSDDENLFLHPTSADVSAFAPVPVDSFYVLNSSFHVYKCLNNSNNSVSTVEPTGTSLTSFGTSDGYLWKYIYSVIPSDMDRFVTEEWIPVQTLLLDDGLHSTQWQVQQNAVDGTIDAIFVETAGTTCSPAQYSGTIVSVNTNQITFDVSASTQANAYVGATIFVTSGAAINEHRLIISYDNVNLIATLDSAFTNTPSALDTFDVLPTITISGDGAGAFAKATVSAGSISSVSVVDRGTGYHQAESTVSGYGISGSVLVPSISPIGGHGLDPVEEFGAFFVMMNVKLDYNETNFPLSNDYRKLGIIRNVKDFGGLQLSTALTLKGEGSLTLDTIVGTFDPDDIITANPFSPTPSYARVVEFSGSTVTYVQDLSTGFGLFYPSDSITSSPGGASANVLTVNTPDIEKYSGDLIYIEYRRPIMRASDQQEDLKFIVEW